MGVPTQCSHTLTSRKMKNNKTPWPVFTKLRQKLRKPSKIKRKLLIWPLSLPRLKSLLQTSPLTCKCSPATNPPQKLIQLLENHESDRLFSLSKKEARTKLCI